MSETLRRGPSGRCERTWMLSLPGFSAVHWAETGLALKTSARLAGTLQTRLRIIVSTSFSLRSKESKTTLYRKLSELASRPPRLLICSVAVDVASSPDRADAVVIGAGFGGLGAALSLAERGANVVLLEALTYPGGCASTFERGGYRFEAGATLFSGLGPNQLFDRWIRKYGLDVTVDWLDPVVEIRAPSLRIAVPSDRERFVARLLELPGAPRENLLRFFDKQRRVADVLWGLLERPELLPPFRLPALGRHALRAADYARLLPYVGRPLGSVLEDYGLGRFEPLRLYLDALCQITVQCPLDEAEALLAMGTMDYYFRGTGHIRGGIGRLATALLSAVRAAGGFVSMANQARGLERTGRGWRVRTRRFDVETPLVIANVLPQNVSALVPEAHRLDRSEALGLRVEEGWGAAMLYRVVRAPDGASPKPVHLDLTADPAGALIEGNHLFCSFSGAADGDRAPEGYRTLTTSTHVHIGRHEDPAAYFSSVHDKMRRTLRELAPEWEEEVLHEMTASPRTFERFTRRRDGFVGGVPKRAGLHNYRHFWPSPVADGVYLVGDSLFPGQSTLAAALGGRKLAEHLAA